MSGRGIQPRPVTSSAEMAFQQPHGPHQPEPALAALPSGFAAAQSCWERPSRDTSGKITTKPNTPAVVLHTRTPFSEEKVIKYLKKNSRLCTSDLLPAEQPYLAPERSAGVRAQDSWDGITPSPFVMRKLWETQARTDDLSTLVSQRARTLAKQNHYQQ